MRRIFGEYRLYAGLFLVVFILAALPLALVNGLLSPMVQEERSKIETWARATEALAARDDRPATDLMLNIVSSNRTIPVILTSQSGEVISYSNIKLRAQTAQDSIREVQTLLEQFAQEYPPIRIDLGEGVYQNLYYSQSTTLKKLLFLPHWQMWIFLAFLLLIVMVLMMIRRNEQNRLWVGLSKETAHQLGTPISSLWAWVELLDSPEGDVLLAEASPEMRKDVERLQLIAERFSKIGSLPTPEEVNLNTLLQESHTYLERRISSEVDFSVLLPPNPVIVRATPSLLSWVIENIVKNAVDATDGRGVVQIRLTLKGRMARVDVSDNGKGIPKSKQRAVFRPGYTTKSRGWGLGLSLAQRIVEKYHKGKIFVHRSEVNRGTIIRILLPLLP